MNRNALLCGLAVLALISTPSTAAEVNVYSARNEALIKPLLDRFSEATGIQVNLVTGKADALLKRLQSEGRNSPADLLITTDAGRLQRAKAAGVLQPVDSDSLQNAVPEQYRDPDGHWFGLSIRARTIVYAKERLSPAQLSRYEALAEPQWKGRICVRSSDNIYNQSLVASMMVADGTENTQRWVDGLVANLARSPRGGDRDQIKAVAAGLCDVALVNTYYLGGMIQSTDQQQQAAAAKVAVFWPNQQDRGTHVNVSGAGVTSAAPHRDNAQRLLEFLVTDPSQQWYAQINNEYPVKPGVAWSETLQAWGDFKRDPVNLALLGSNNPEAVRIMDRAGWK